MTFATVVRSSQQPPRYPVDWTHVRSVYRKMNDDFFLITEPFGIRIDSELDDDLAHLIATIDVVDRHLDTIETQTDREVFSKRIVSFLNAQPGCQLRLPDTIRQSEELNRRLECLRDLIIRRNIQSVFADTIESVFFHTEAKRNANDRNTMIQHLVTEWGLAGRLPVLVMGPASTERFERFFFLCCEMMPAVDMILDARADFRAGQLSVRPTLTLYLSLLGIFLLPLPRLFRLFPKPTNLIRYTVTFLNHVYIRPVVIRLMGRPKKIDEGSL